MHRFILALSCILIMLAAPISAQDFQKGLEAYRNGDYATALKEWTPLAEGGDSVAQYNLGVMYKNGWGVSQDDKEAVRWYRLAAEQGYAMAQFTLGAMYENGQGVLADYVIAHMWYDIADVNGNEKGAGNREDIAKEMMPEGISKAEAMATVCMISNYKKCGY
jgi:uncharacterized protein